MSTDARMRTVGVLALAGYVAVAATANYLTSRFGSVAVGLGRTATAGTYCAGAALMLRNLVQDTLGRRVVIVGIAAGAALSWATSTPSLAVASGAAFAVAESADMSIYTPLRRRGWVCAVVPASVLGALVDTFVFLTLAGIPDSPDTVLGQMLGKTWACWLPVVLVSLWRSRRAVSDDTLGP